MPLKRLADALLGLSAEQLAVATGGRELVEVVADDGADQEQAD
jgi:hypothetical protein